MIKDYTGYFSHFISEHVKRGIKYHHSCHSHHFWPDVTLQAVQDYWWLAARRSDEKWGDLFSQEIPLVQESLDSELKLHGQSNISFASNTHELLFRLLSCLDWKNKKTIVTTDSEFYSFERQSKRFEEEQIFTVVKVPVQPLATFVDRFIQTIKRLNPQVVFLSQVFFNSGLALNEQDFLAINNVLDPEQMLIIDGYHGFMAVPFDFGPLASKAFYLGGSYKYLGGGEGLCFLISPKHCQLRPLYTGWFAEIERLSERKVGEEEVYFSNDGMRFYGSTMDFSCLCKVNSIFRLYKNEGIDGKSIHQHVRSLQKDFYHKIRNSNLFSPEDIVNNPEKYPDRYGHFFAMDCGTPEAAKSKYDQLLNLGVSCDRRQSILRIGFSLYHFPGKTFFQDW